MPNFEMDEIKSKLTAQEVEDNFNSEKDLTDFFTEEVDPVTHDLK